MFKKIINIVKIRRQKIFFIDNPNDISTILLNANIRLTNISYDNVEHIKDFRSDKHITTFSKFLEDGQYGIYAWIDSKVVGHAWAKVCTKDSDKVNGYMDIFRDEALIHFCRVSENYRGKNIFPAMLETLCLRLFSEAKIWRVLIDTEVDNTASLRGINKVGFKPLGKGTYVQFRGRLIHKSENLKY